MGCAGARSITMICDASDNDHAIHVMDDQSISGDRVYYKTVSVDFCGISVKMVMVSLPPMRHFEQLVYIIPPIPPVLQGHVYNINLVCATCTITLSPTCGELEVHAEKLPVRKPPF